MNFFYKHRVALGFISILLAVTVTFGICFFALARTAAQAQRLTVVIDAGHGGVDGGVVGKTSGRKESDINLSISRYLQEEFEEAGFLVVQTRPTAWRRRAISVGICKSARRSSIPILPRS